MKIINILGARYFVVLDTTLGARCLRYGARHKRAPKFSYPAYFFKI